MQMSGIDPIFRRNRYEIVRKINVKIHIIPMPKTVSSFYSTPSQKSEKFGRMYQRKLATIGQGIKLDSTINISFDYDKPS